MRKPVRCPRCGRPWTPAAELRRTAAVCPSCIGPAAARGPAGGVANWAIVAAATGLGLLIVAGAAALAFTLRQTQPTNNPPPIRCGDVAQASPAPAATVSPPAAPEPSGPAPVVETT